MINYGKKYSEEIQKRIQEFIALDKNKEKIQIEISPLEIAQIMGHKEIVSLLSQYELKKQYLDYLEHNGHYDLSFVPLKSSARHYSHIVVDEASI